MVLEMAISHQLFEEFSHLPPSEEREEVCSQISETKMMDDSNFSSAAGKEAALVLLEENGHLPFKAHWQT